MQSSIENIKTQRNFFLVYSLVLSVVCVPLVLKVCFGTEKTIIVPGASREAWITDKGVSQSYLEEVTTTYLPLLLDLDVYNIFWKRDKILTDYVSESNEKYRKDLHDYFARVKEYYTHHSLSTHFALKNIDSDPTNMTVIAHGLLVQHFGNKGREVEKRSYMLKLEWVGRKLLIKEFKRVTKEDLND